VAPVGLAALVSEEQAFWECWEECPLLSRDLDKLDEIFNLRGCESLVDHGALRAPFFRMVRAGDAVDAARITRPVVPGVNTLPGLIDPHGVRRELSGGATLVLQGLRLLVASVDAFCDRISDDLGHPVHANAYLTPANSQGEAAHYDPHSVFIKQLCGSKRWIVRNGAEKWPANPCSDTSAVDGPVVLEETLEAGDSLYLPRGFVHQGSAMRQPSLHLTLSMVDPVNWASVLVENLYERALLHSGLREILPPKFDRDPTALATLVKSKLASLRGLLDECDSEQLVAQLINNLGPASWWKPPVHSLADHLGPSSVGRAVAD
jgi:hypothetical protein